MKNLPIISRDTARVLVRDLTSLTPEEYGQAWRDSIADIGKYNPTLGELLVFLALSDMNKQQILIVLLQVLDAQLENDKLSELLED